MPDKQEICQQDKLSLAEQFKQEERKKLQKNKVEGDVFLEIARLRYTHGLPISRIAEYVGLSYYAVYHRLARFEKLIGNKEDIEVYEAHKSQFLSKAELELVAEILNKKKLEKAGMGELAKAFREIFNANRLTQQKSTINVNYHGIVSEMKQLEKAISEYEDSYEATD